MKRGGLGRFFGLLGIATALAGGLMWVAAAGGFALAVWQPQLQQGAMRDAMITAVAMGPVFAPMLGLLAMALGLTGYLDARMSGGYSIESTAALALGSVGVLMGVLLCGGLGAVALA